MVTARGLFTDEDFYSAYKGLETARRALCDGEPEDAITASVAFLESTMRICHDRLGEPLPEKNRPHTRGSPPVPSWVLKRPAPQSALETFSAPFPVP